MSELGAVRAELRLAWERSESAGYRRLGWAAAIGLLMLAVVAASAEMQVLASFSADDFGSILLGAG